MDADRLRSDLVRDEGLRLKPYRDTVGKLTIGVGRNLDDVGISQPEALVLLSSDIERVVSDLTARVPCWVALDEVRQRVLANMAFNLGISRLLGFVQTLSAVQSGRWADASVAMLSSVWAQQVGPRATRLAEMMRTGQDPPA